MASKKTPKPQTQTEAPAEGARTGDTETWIERETANTASNLREAIELRQQLLSDFNAGADVAASLDAIEREIEAHQKKMIRLADARAIRDAQQTDEARKARREAVRKNLQAALDDSRKLGGEIQELLHVFSEVGARLTSIAAKRDSIRARVLDAVRDDGPQHRVEEQHRVVRQLVERLTLPAHLQRRIWESGLGRTGIELDPAVFSLRSFSVTTDPEAEVNKVVERLREIGEKALREAA